MTRRTPLFDQHVQAGAHMVEFAGWEMPMHYGSQIEEHHQVRNHAGIFDVSHMGVVDIQGKQTQAFLRYALANDVQKLHETGDALYSCMLNEQGGIIDDLIVYHFNNEYYRVVLNAGSFEKDFAWLNKLAAEFDVTLKYRDDLTIIAVQGPQAIANVLQVLGKQWAGIDNLKAFKSIFQDDLLVARTGYTGEDGVEIILPKQKASEVWRSLVALGVKPCGLGARDTLRLEAGLNLYGTDMNEDTSPLVSNLAWTVSWQDEDRDFMGKAALQKEKASGVEQKLVGIIMQEPGVLRNHQTVLVNGELAGEITSGSFSPTLGHAIALARLPSKVGDDVFIERRNKQIAVKIVKPPFVRLGKKVYKKGE